MAGWTGNALEAEWAEYVLASVADKLGDIDTYSVSDCDLLIYDNTPTGAPEPEHRCGSAWVRIFQEFSEQQQQHHFGVVSVIRDPWLIYDIAGPHRLLAYRPEWGVP